MNNDNKILSIVNVGDGGSTKMIGGVLRFNGSWFLCFYRVFHKIIFVFHVCDFVFQLVDKQVILIVSDVYKGFLVV